MLSDVPCAVGCSHIFPGEMPAQASLPTPILLRFQSVCFRVALGSRCALAWALGWAFFSAAVFRRGALALGVQGSVAVVHVLSRPQHREPSRARGQAHVPLPWQVDYFPPAPESSPLVTAVNF